MQRRGSVARMAHCSGAGHVRNSSSCLQNPPFRPAARCLVSTPAGGGSSAAAAGEEQAAAPDEVSAALSALSNAVARAIALDSGAGGEAGSIGMAIPSAREASPVGTLDSAALAAAFASGRTGERRLPAGAGLLHRS